MHFTEIWSGIYVYELAMLKRGSFETNCRELKRKLKRLDHQTGDKNQKLSFPRINGELRNNANLKRAPIATTEIGFIDENTDSSSCSHNDESDNVENTPHHLINPRLKDIYLSDSRQKHKEKLREYFWLQLTKLQSFFSIRPIQQVCKSSNRWRHNSLDNIFSRCLFILILMMPWIWSTATAECTFPECSCSLWQSIG